MHVMQLKHISHITVEKLLVVLPVVAVVLFHKSQFKHSTLSPPKTILAIESLSVVGDIWRHGQIVWRHGQIVATVFVSCPITPLSAGFQLVGLDWSTNPSNV